MRNQSLNYYAATWNTDRTGFFEGNNTLIFSAQNKGMKMSLPEGRKAGVRLSSGRGAPSQILEIPSESNLQAEKKKNKYHARHSDTVSLFTEGRYPLAQGLRGQQDWDW